MILFLALLPFSFATHDCYNTLCVGTDDPVTTIPCDQSTMLCTIQADGKPKCDTSPEGGAGVECLVPNFYCSASDAGAALCVYTTSSCYNNKCQGAEGASTTFIDCDQSTNTCSVDDTGLPVCNPGNIGIGVNCTVSADNDEFYCQNDLTDGAAMCVYPPKHDCYDTTCTGIEAFNETVIACDQSSNRCSFNATGAPVCIDTTRGEGVDCSKDDEFYCNVDDKGAGVCVVPPVHSCYDLQCVGTGAFNETTIDCDQKDHRCVLSTEGEPSCVNTTRGAGVDCSGTEHEDFYCNNGDSGAAVCVVTPPSSCYNLKCGGTGDQSATFIDCDESANLCQVDETGAPLCEPLSRGAGVNCTTTVENDEFYCQNDLTDGAAMCVYPPKHDCYDTTCTGIEAFNETVIACDQSSNRCSVNATGAPVCIDTTRGEGVDCSKDDEFYCNVNDKGAGVCVVPPVHSCYDLQCVGTGAFNETTLDCDQKDHRCVLSTEGEPSCVNTTRGAGVDCSGTEHEDFYCNNGDTGDAVCVVTPPRSCYNLKCGGTGDQNATFIDCDQSANLCQVDETGAPLCEPLSRGAGVNCTTTEENDEFYCQNDITNGAAVCVYPPKHDCYESTCTGKDAFNTTIINCDQSSNRCGFNATGAPVCIDTTRGAGVDCAHTSDLDFYCGETEVSGAQCVFTPPQSCYSQFCQGTGLNNASWASCDGAKHRCSVADDGSPLCVDGSRGSGVQCNKTLSFYCSPTVGDPFTASCVYPKQYDCYNSKCQGVFNNSQTFVGCSQDTSYCTVNADGFPLCINDNSTTGEGVSCTGHFSCKEDTASGVAACQKKGGLLPLWIVLGVAVAVVIVVAIIWVIKRRSTADDRQSLLTPAF